MFTSPSSSSSDEETAKKPESMILAAARGVARHTAVRRMRSAAESSAAAAAAAAFKSTDTAEATNENLKDKDNEKSKIRSKYIGKLLVSAKRRAEESEQRRVEQAQRSQVQRFVTKSYEAALRRRDEARRAQISFVLATEEGHEQSRQQHSTALTFVVAEAADKLRDAAERNKNDDGNDVRRTEGHHTKSVMQQWDDGGNNTTTGAKITTGDNEDGKRNINIDGIEKEGVEDQSDKHAKDEDLQKDGASALGIRKDKPKRSQKVRRKRGERRNDADSIEAYRKRYFERLAQRRASKSK